MIQNVHVMVFLCLSTVLHALHTCVSVMCRYHMLQWRWLRIEPNKLLCYTFVFSIKTEWFCMIIMVHITQEISSSKERKLHRLNCPSMLWKNWHILYIMLLSFMLSNVEIESIWFPEHDLLNNISSFFVHGYCSSFCGWEPDKGYHRQTVHENVASLFPHFTWTVVFSHTPPTCPCVHFTHVKKRDAF